MAHELTTYAGASHFANDSNYEVQRSNHFEIVLDLAAIGLDDDYAESIRLTCLQAPIPSIQINDQTLVHGNETIHVAGKPSYGSINLQVYDAIGKDMAGRLQEWHYKVFNPDDHTMGLVKNYKTTATVYAFSPDASVVRKWVLYGVYPTSIEISQFSASSNGDPCTISLQLQVDKVQEFKVK